MFEKFKIMPIIVTIVVCISFLLNVAIAAEKKEAVKVNTLEDVCTKITKINGLLVKITAGGHIGKGDPRYPGYTILCGPKCAKFPAKVYHCDGSQAFRLGYYGKWAGNGKSRGYCAAGGVAKCKVSTVRARSKALECKGVGYLDIDGSNGKSCMSLNLNSDRNGSIY